MSAAHTAIVRITCPDLSPEMGEAQQGLPSLRYAIDNGAVQDLGPYPPSQSSAGASRPGWPPSPLAMLHVLCLPALPALAIADLLHLQVRSQFIFCHLFLPGWVNKKWLQEELCRALV